MSGRSVGGDRKERALVTGFDLVFLDEAARSVGRARQAAAGGHASEEGGSSAAAILCAAAACEALLSEEIAANPSNIWHEEGSRLVQQVRKARSPQSSWKTYLKAVAPNDEFPDSAEYRDLDCLFKVRHHVAHRSARILPYGEWPKRLRDCIAQGKVPIRTVETEVDWTSVLFVHEVAAWAHDVALTWMRKVAWYTPHARLVRGSLGRNVMLEDKELLSASA